MVMSWVALVGVLCVWAGVVLFAWYVFQLHTARVAYVSSVGLSTTKQIVAARMHVLARETSGERAALEGSENADVLSVVSVIESTGTAAGVKVQVSDVQTVRTVPGKGGAPAFNVIGFQIQSQGSFSSMMQVAEMLESLPLPTDIDQLDLGRSPIRNDPESAKALWHLNIHLKLVTTASVSS